MCNTIAYITTAYSRNRDFDDFDFFEIDAKHVVAGANAALSGVEGGSELLKQVSEMFGTASKTLSGVKDADSATAALPELGKLTEGFGGMTEQFSKLPDAAKDVVSGIFQSSLGQLQPIIDKVMGIPGIEAILKPAIEAMMSKLDAFKS